MDLTYLVCVLTVSTFSLGISSIKVPNDELMGDNAKWIYMLGGDVMRSETYKDEPGPRSRIAGWADQWGNLWTFSGIALDSANHMSPHLTNDLWLFNLTTKKWTEVRKPYLLNNDTYHEHGPPPRRGAVTCGVSDIIFVVYGGEAVGPRMLGDTWLYDIKKKLWITLYEAHSEKNIQSHPPGRESPVFWCLPDKLVIYGGSNNNKILNDMWIFSLRNLTWTEVTDPINTPPGGRMAATVWNGPGDSIFMFGGASEDEQKSRSIESDLWQFSIDSKTWKLLHHGSPSADVQIDIVDRSTAIQQPEPRKNALGWNDPYKNLLYLHGGEGLAAPSVVARKAIVYDELWEFNVKSNSWRKISYYTATLDLKKKITSVPGRTRAVTWVGPQGAFFTFAGLAYNQQQHLSLLNDVWALIPPKTKIPESLHLPSLEIVKYPQHNHTSHSRSPSFIFLMVLLTFGGLVMVVGAIFCLKKMSDYPRHRPSKSYKVRYSKLAGQGELEDESHDFLMQDDLEEARASFRIQR